MAIEDRKPIPRVTLPKNLLVALQGLGDLDLGTLQREVAAEIKRGRGRANGQQVAAASTEVAAGKASLIWVSYQAGMKPGKFPKGYALTHMWFDVAEARVA